MLRQLGIEPVAVDGSHDLLFQNPDGRAMAVQITADADGRFRFPELTPGRWVLRASADGHSLKPTATADVISGEWVNA